MELHDSQSLQKLEIVCNEIKYLFQFSAQLRGKGYVCLDSISFTHMYASGNLIDPEIRLRQEIIIIITLLIHTCLLRLERIREKRKMSRDQDVEI